MRDESVKIMNLDMIPYGMMWDVYVLAKIKIKKDTTNILF
jgi:hypothetical protein